VAGRLVPQAQVVAEGGVHDVEHGLRGAEGVFELLRLERLADAAQPLAEMALHPVEALGVRALEGEDRLLAVAHHKDRALAAWGSALRRPRTHRRGVR
jgi:hypothetical protein